MLNRIGADNSGEVLHAISGPERWEARVDSCGWKLVALSDREREDLMAARVDGSAVRLAVEQLRPRPGGYRVTIGTDKYMGSRFGELLNNIAEGRSGMIYDLLQGQLPGIMHLDELPTPEYLQKFLAAAERDGHTFSRTGEVPYMAIDSGGIPGVAVLGTLHIHDGSRSQVLCEFPRPKFSDFLIYV